MQISWAQAEQLLLNGGEQFCFITPTFSGTPVYGFWEGPWLWRGVYQIQYPHWIWYIYESNKEN
jgi:hypothetical protein